MLKKEFLKYCSANNMSDITVKDYINSLDIVCKSIMNKPFSECLIDDFISLNNSNYTDFINEQKTNGLRANTIKLRLNSLKAIYRFLLNRDYISIDESYKRDYILNHWIKSLKDSSDNKKKKEILTIEEIEKILYTINTLGKNILRRRLFVLMLVTNGLRISELINIKLSDINFDDKSITIKGKGDKIAVISITEQVADTLDMYLRIERIRYCNSKDNPYLFLTNRGTQLTSRHSDSEIKTICEKANITKSISCHRLRATFGTIAYEQSGDIYDAMVKMRHSSISTTQLYINDRDKKIEPISITV